MNKLAITAEATKAHMEAAMVPGVTMALSEGQSQINLIIRVRV